MYSPGSADCPDNSIDPSVRTKRGSQDDRKMTKKRHARSRALEQKSLSVPLCLRGESSQSRSPKGIVPQMLVPLGPD